VLAQARVGGGFVLMPSCSVHRGFPVAHLQTMIEAARTRG
jgi:uroporphyrinogen-III decarboxylase